MNEENEAEFERRWASLPERTRVILVALYEAFIATGRPDSDFSSWAGGFHRGAEGEPCPVWPYPKGSPLRESFDVHDEGYAAGEAWRTNNPI